MNLRDKFFITRNDVKNAKEYKKFEFGNNVLYSLCKKYPDHKKPEIAMAKIWLIGRSYAAAIERGRPNSKELSTENFYEDVGRRLNRIDKWLNNLRNIKHIEAKNIGRILSVHSKVTELFYETSKLKKRSLASKYLHFHFPGLFFIFDNRAKKGISKIKPRWMMHNNNNNTVSDREYEIFFNKVIQLRQYIKDKWRYNLSPREIDNLLLNKSNGNKLR